MAETANVPALQNEPTAMQSLSVEDVVSQVKKIQELMKLAMKPGEHYGIIPGTVKPTLLKAGAEKLCLLFRLGPSYESVEKYGPGDHLTIKSRCTLYYIPTDAKVGTGEGSCSTLESKYAYRLANPKCPQCGAEAIIKSKFESGGWVCWKKRGGCGGQFPDEQFQNVGKVPNDALPDEWNTVLKMANKRSLIAAVLNATAASDIFTQDLESEIEDVMAFDKVAWQKQFRQKFKEENGYSQAAHYATGGLRLKVLERDGYKCVACGMTDEEHKAKWDKPITVDHINKDKTENTMENLQTLCLSCHGRKDISPKLTEQQVPEFQEQILKWRKEGKTYQVIADQLGFSIAAIWKWCQKWQSEEKKTESKAEALKTLVHTYAEQQNYSKADELAALKSLTSWQAYTKADGTKVKAFAGVSRYEDLNESLAAYGIQEFHRRLKGEKK